MKTDPKSRDLYSEVMTPKTVLISSRKRANYTYLCPHWAFFCVIRTCNKYFNYKNHHTQAKIIKNPKSYFKKGKITLAIFPLIILLIRFLSI